jgi:hypothetical protein
MSRPKVGVHGLEKVGDWTVELSYSGDEENWAVTTGHPDSSKGNQTRGSEHSMRNHFAGVVNGLTLAKGPPALETVTLTVEVEYDPEMTDPGSLAVAADRLLELALSTPMLTIEDGDKLGPVDFGGFTVLPKTAEG